MLFLARMDVTFPETMDADTKADFQAREKEYSGNLQRQGIMKGIWRVVGEYANYSIFDTIVSSGLPVRLRRAGRSGGAYMARSEVDRACEEGPSELGV